ncbi:sugar ABC transporter substrate-binding protein [Paenarthrobacter aurescens]|uniref:D-ribose-binding protein n=1 Tax=Paenarthrobacter aurescens (strain TC1) TaxID=290340 RepID=A1R1Q2_PAEAT|nr:substrate-binding domain-containing protein [Paenarthrobacter aurescens]ABM08554.1 D-ribose-binding protein precursor [Paenarthrobacter aurescens TC1]
MVTKRTTRLAFISSLSAATLLALTACGGSAPASTSSEEKGLIGISMRFIAGNAWLSTMSDGAVKSGTSKGWTMEAVDAQGSAQTQIQQMRTFINKGAKAIIIEPVGDRNVASGIEAAKAAGIPVIVVNDRVSEELAKKVACNVHDDGEATAELVGAKAAEAAVAKKGQNSTINLYIQALFPQELVTESRENGFMTGWNKYMAQHPTVQTKRIPNNYGEALPDKTLTAMRNVLAGNPDLDVVFNQTDVVMPAVIEALKGAGRMDQNGKTEVILAGFDGGMEVIKSMAKDPASPVVADGLNQPALQAAFAVDEAIAAVTGTPTGKCEGSPATRILPALAVTPENAGQYISGDLAFAGAE